MTEPWVWNDETDACVARLLKKKRAVILRPRPATRICSLVGWIARMAIDALGEKTDIDMATSAAAAHLLGRPEELRKR